MVWAFLGSIIICASAMGLLYYAILSHLTFGAYEMDMPVVILPGHTSGIPDRRSFMPLCSNFCMMARSIGTLSTVTLMIAAYFQESLSAGMLTCATLSSFAFATLLPAFYESYLHRRYSSPLVDARSNYTRTRYATVLTLAGSAVITFATGIIALTAILLHR